MESTRKLLGFLLLLWIVSDAAVESFPDSFSKNEISSSKNPVGVSSQIIANALIQGQADSTANYVSSPIGYSTILSILGQGANGKTLEEILAVLELPNNLEDVRNSYRSVLTDFSGNDSTIQPQFKTWFYIYKNNKVNDEFRSILANDYLVEVKDIERFDMDMDGTYNYQSDGKPTSSNDILDFDDFNLTKSGDVENTETSVKEAIADYDQIDKGEKEKVSKFDKEVDDKVYVEKSEIADELKTTTVNDETESGPEKFTIPIKKFTEDSMEIMEAQENRNFVNRFGRAQPLHMQGDVTSALSGNSIMGRKETAMESKMLLFNGLYFRGDWNQKFKKMEEKLPFENYKEKQDVKYMKSDGLFKFAEISSQNLIAVELPYKNDRYSLLIIMPKAQNDMKQFCKQSNYNILNEIIAQMEPENLQLYVPTFRFECTSRAEKALGKLGLTTLFTSKADLRGISEESKGFQIEELVQHVAIRIDEVSSAESALSAGNVQGRQNQKSSEVKVDKPFVFYVRDTLNDIILTTGKIMEIPSEEEVPVHFNI